MEENHRARKDSGISIPTTVSPTGSEPHRETHDSFLCGPFRQETWRAERNCLTWFTAVIDTLTPPYFTFSPIMLEYLGVPDIRPPKFIGEVKIAYMMLHVSYAIQLIMGIIIMYNFFKRENKFLPHIIVAHTIGSGILAACNIYFVYSVLATLGSPNNDNLKVYEFAQLVNSYFTIFRLVLVYVWNCCIKRVCMN